MTRWEKAHAQARKQFWKKAYEQVQIRHGQQVHAQAPERGRNQECEQSRFTSTRTRMRVAREYAMYWDAATIMCTQAQSSASKLTHKNRTSQKQGYTQTGPFEVEASASTRKAVLWLVYNSTKLCWGNVFLYDALVQCCRRRRPRTVSHCLYAIWT